MKKTIMILLAALAVSAPMQAQDMAGASKKPAGIMCERGVGPAMSGSMDASALPQSSRDFLAKYFPGVAVTKAQNDFSDRKYEVDLADGAEVSFDYNGNWIEVDAPDGATLPSSTLASLIPEAVVMETLSGNALVDGGALNYVEEVVSYPDFYVMKMRTATEKSRVAVSRSDGSAKQFKTKAGNARQDRHRAYKSGRGEKGGRNHAVRLDLSPRFTLE